MIDLDALSLRDLQKESARALSYWQPTNNELSQFNKQAHHDSQQFYKAVIRKYVEEFGDLPSKAGPAQHIRLLTDD